MMSDILFHVSWITLAIWLVSLGPMWIDLIRPRRLADVDPDRGDGELWPSVSIVMAARDEGETIEQSVGSLKRIDYPNLEIILVDDRSRDRTGEVMDRSAHGCERIKVVHIQDLPSGWLGKNHAMYQGYRRSRGQWLLFTDGDVIFEPLSVRRAIQYMEAQRRDHMAVFPTLIPGDWLENAALTLFSMLIMMRVQSWLVRTPFKYSYVGVGAFNLIRRSCYESIGTHQRMPLEVVDDVKLGKLVKRNNFRQDWLNGQDEVKVRYQVGIGGIIRGLTKNAFASLDFSIIKLVGITLLFMVSGWLPYYAALTMPYPANLIPVAILAFLHLTLGVFHWRLRQNPLLALTFPLTWFLFLYIGWRSAIVTLRQGGVTWRDTFYPLAELRKGVV